VEAGRKIALNQEWTMTPQAQLSYNAVDFDSFRDAYDVHVSREDGDALTGRLGLAFNREKAWKSEAGDTRRLKTYGIGNLYYEFLNGTEVSVTNVDFRNRSDRFWGGLGTGVSYNWQDDAYSIYGEIDGRTSFSDFGDSYSLNGTVGFRARF
ncbi:autotransporter outer membrane beta-barrel domain-containing protein, partial [Bartonella sp. LJL80]